MDIKILDSWLREYLNTSATPEEISKYLSLCGPSVERIEKINQDFIYDIEVTTNRVDTASVYGIAREASAMLPRFGIKASLKHVEVPKVEYNFVPKVNYLKAVVDKNLCPRFTAVLIRNVTIADSSPIVKKRLESAGIRAINNVIDISNYIMLELGQPVHTFDYDKIKGASMRVRESRKGEIIKTLDEKNFTLPGGDIVIEDGKGRLIDLCGIMGGALSAIDEYTKNVLLFVQTYNPGKIRKTSMSLAQRTIAASLFEKGTDPENVAPAILSAIALFNKYTGGISDKNIFNIYPNPYKVKSVSLDLEFISERLGIEISKKDITDYLESLEFCCSWNANVLSVKIPSFRANDVTIEEDVVEEIARIYGYYNLPSSIMTGQIPVNPEDSKFSFETEIKNIISGFGGTEVYTLSLVPKSYVDEKHLRLINPLGPESEYLRTSLMPSLVSAAKGNNGLREKFHLFEMANVYIPLINDLPEEHLMIGGIFSGYSYRNAKGVVESILARLHIEYSFKAEESKGFGASKMALIYHKDLLIGKIGIIDNSELIYYELSVRALRDTSPKIKSFKYIPKYPAQIEDLTFSAPTQTKIGEVIKSIMAINDLIREVGYVGDFNGNYTLRIRYQSNEKTLTNTEVKDIRNKIISFIKTKFGGVVKD